MELLLGSSFELTHTSVSYLFLSLSLINSDLVNSFQLANIRFSRFCEEAFQQITKYKNTTKPKCT